MASTRSSPIHLVKRALSSPERVLPYLRRRMRNLRLRRGTESHPEFYRKVMADDVDRRGGRGAVGTASEKRWLELGAFQFEYLTTHGLEPHHRLLEIGCGNLRAGWRFIEWLGPGQYTGVDISPEILIEATKTLRERELQDKTPSLYLYDGLDLGFLPSGHFDVVHAHSVFSHTPIEVIDAVVGGVSRVLRRGGFFDFTYNRSDTTWGFLEEDFYYPADQLIALAGQHGLDARPAEGWDYVQDKIRAVKT